MFLGHFDPKNSTFGNNISSIRGDLTNTSAVTKNTDLLELCSHLPQCESAHTSLTRHPKQTILSTTLLQPVVV